ncbi:MAG: TIGR03862 family flavoprotein [Gammaproteobacteria bacterium]
MPDSLTTEPVVAVIGGGPAGLMAAEVIARQGVAVAVYDAMPSLGRKFLMAGKSGLNLTHAEDLDRFLSRYGDRRDVLTPLVEAFGPQALREWARDLGVATFIGSSGRVFPTAMKAAPLLRAWLHRLRATGVRIHVRHRWLGFTADGGLRFATPDGEVQVRAAATVLALGGGSWARLGSDGGWVPILQQFGISLRSLQPANCGFEVNWSAHLRERFAGEALKSVSLRLLDRAGVGRQQQGDFVVTTYGIEGGLVYAFAAELREIINVHGQATLYLDLLPDWPAEKIHTALRKPRGKRSMSQYLRRQLGLTGVKLALIHELISSSTMSDPLAFAEAIKALPIVCERARPIDEAISTAGGIPFEALDAHLMLKQLPGVFCAGEMLDWEAPTGGYLLTACFASGYAAAHGVLHWLANNHMRLK